MGSPPAAGTKEATEAKREAEVEEAAPAAKVEEGRPAKSRRAEKKESAEALKPTIEVSTEAERAEEAVPKGTERKEKAELKTEQKEAASPVAGPAQAYETPAFVESEVDYGSEDEEVPDFKEEVARLSQLDDAGQEAEAGASIDLDQVTRRLLERAVDGTPAKRLLTSLVRAAVTDSMRRATPALVLGRLWHRRRMTLPPLPKVQLEVTKALVQRPRFVSWSSASP